MLERRIATASQRAANSLSVVCGVDDLRAVHNELIRAMEDVPAASDTDMRDPRLCAELFERHPSLTAVGCRYPTSRRRER